MELTRRQDRYRKSFIIVLIVVLLSSCIFIGSVLAWLQQNTTRESIDTITLGEVDFEIYNGTTKISSIKSTASGVTTIGATQELEVSGTSTIRTVNLSIRNTGTIDAIMRVTLSIYFKDNYNNKVALVLKDIPSADTEIAIQNDGWVNDFKDDVTSGYTYYNNVINPYTIRRVINNEDGTQTITSQDVTANAVSVLTQLLLPNSMSTTKYYITLTVEGVAYKGNIYQELADKDAGNSYQIPVEAYPFGLPESLPATWTAWQ
ncbi:MAG: hypothetical protein ACI4PF_00150 [Christensenellales bacterium]